MKYLLPILMLALLCPLTGQAWAAAPTNNCVSCHMEFEDEDGPAHQFQKDVHGQNELSCYDCHGGDPTLEDMDDVRHSPGFRGAPKHLDIPTFCARCHADARYMHDHNPALPVDQYDKYLTSVHGQRLMQKKDMKVATCVSCHTAHQIGSAKMPYSTTYPQNIPATCGKCHSDADYMKEYPIPTDQLDLYKQSVHGEALLVKGDLGAPACNSCHGNHGAAPPGVNSLNAVCGMCHAIEAQLFDASPHRDAFEVMGMPLCMTCHSNHKIVKPTDHMIGLESGQICSECHDAGDQTGPSADIRSISLALAHLVASYDSAASEVRVAAAKGMMTTDEDFALKEVDQIKVQTRSSIHAAAVDSLVPKATDGIKKSDEITVKAQGLIHEFYFRRWGLGVSSLIITLLVIGLAIKIKSLK